MLSPLRRFHRRWLIFSRFRCLFIITLMPLWLPLLFFCAIMLMILRCHCFRRLSIFLPCCHFRSAPAAAMLLLPPFRCRRRAPLAFARYFHDAAIFLDALIAIGFRYFAIIADIITPR